MIGHSILEMDEPEHHRYRGLIQQAFTRKAMETLGGRPRPAPSSTQLIDAFAERGRADLVRELTFPFPVKVIAGMLGLPAEDLPLFHRQAVELISVAVDIRARASRRRRAARLLRRHPRRERRADPRHDLISVLAGAELDGQRLTDEEIFAFLRLLLPAGAETTYRSSSNLLFGLLVEPRPARRARARPLADAAGDRGGRCAGSRRSPASCAPRPATSRSRACPSRRARRCIVCIGAANRDPARWDRPRRVRHLPRAASRTSRSRSGPHMCLGMHLARMETRVALNALLDRLPNLRLDPDGRDVHITGLAFRAPTSLPVLFAPR